VIAIVDYGLGNLASVRNALVAIGADVIVSSDPKVVRSAAGIILPGVGAARAGMQGLESRDLADAVVDAAQSGTPLLGHCLGMQLLFEESEENGGTRCLGVLGGKVRRFEGEMKIPHIGWNEVVTKNGNMWDGLPESPYFYFVHSYVCVPENADVIAGVTQYGGEFCSAVVDGSVWGVQFHPERSGSSGLLLMRNFVCLCAEGTHHALEANRK
jgi:imidazole glycerol-phosphate synthase subunit HisH